MILSHSQLATARACLRLHHYRYHLRVESVVTAEPLSAGRRVDFAVKTGDDSGLKPLERAIVHGYRATWRTQPLQCTNDFPFVVRLGNHEIAGEMDGVTGDGWIWELKTTSEDIAPGSLYWKRIIYSDAQCSSYLAALPSAKGIIYDVMRKSALRGKQGETDDQLYARALKNIAKRPEHYYQRVRISRTADETAAFARDVNGTVKLIQATRDDPPRNPDACHRYGRECEFFDVCYMNGDLRDERKFKPRVDHKDRIRAKAAASEGADLRAPEDRKNDAGPVDSGSSDVELRRRGGHVQGSEDRATEVLGGESGSDPRYRF